MKRPIVTSAVSEMIARGKGVGECRRGKAGRNDDCKKLGNIHSVSYFDCLFKVLPQSLIGFYQF